MGKGTCTPPRQACRDLATRSKQQRNLPQGQGKQHCYRYSLRSNSSRRSHEASAQNTPAVRLLHCTAAARRDASSKGTRSANRTRREPLISLPDIQQSSWRRFPKLALDCAITSPFQNSVMRPSASIPLAAADRYTDLKRHHADMQQRCARQNLGFEPMILESTGGFGGELLHSSNHWLN